MHKTCENCKHAYSQGCKNCTECTSKYDEQPSNWEPGEDYGPMTNADRIRAMSDYDLAWELMTWRCEAVAKHHGVQSVYPDTQSTILTWLQQPAEVKNA